MKNKISILLCVTLMVSMLAGCGSSSFFWDAADSDGTVTEEDLLMNCPEARDNAHTLLW